MNKKTFSIFSLIWLCFNVSAQNLVPNYSFESRLHCILGPNQFVGYVADWGGGATELSYFTSQCKESGDSVPLSQYGYQYAHTGNAYAGIMTFEDDTNAGSTFVITNNQNYRNYIQGQFIDS